MQANFPAVIQKQTPLVIGNISIHQDDQGRYCLNDLHRAAGGAKKHQPSNWLANKQTIELVEELSITGITGIEQKQGLGTFVCKELVYGYAMWISAAFNLKVIRAYDSMVTTPAIPQDPFLAQMEMVKTVYINQLEIKREQEQHRQQIAEHSDRIDALKPRLTAGGINTIQGEINRTAKVYRQAQALKHIKVNVTESTGHYRLLLHDKFNVADIGYLSDIKPACKLLQAEAKKQQAVVDDWYNRNNLFAGGTA